MAARFACRRLGRRRAVTGGFDRKDAVDDRRLHPLRIRACAGEMTIPASSPLSLRLDLLFLRLLLAVGCKDRYCGGRFLLGSVLTGFLLRKLGQSFGLLDYALTVVTV